MLKVDMGDHYYDGYINISQFPSEIQEPISVVEKSLTNYSQDNTHITGVFNPNTETSLATYDITFKCTHAFFTIEKEISIKMTWHMKEQMDYINERFTEMQCELHNLRSDNDELRDLVNKLEKKLVDLEIIDEGDEEVEVKVITTKPEPVTSTSKRRTRQ
jgi:ATP-dependent Lon protease